MKRIWVMSAALFVLVGVYGCGILDDTSGPTFEIVGNTGPVDIDYDNNQPGDYNQGDYESGGCCGGDEGAGNLCSLTSCTDIPDELCVQNGGPKECRSCEGCIPAE